MVAEDGRHPHRDGAGALTRRVVRNAIRHRDYARGSDREHRLAVAVPVRVPTPAMVARVLAAGVHLYPVDREPLGQVWHRIVADPDHRASMLGGVRWSEPDPPVTH